MLPRPPTFLPTVTEHLCICAALQGRVQSGGFFVINDIMLRLGKCTGKTVQTVGVSQGGSQPVFSGKPFLAISLNCCSH